MKKNVLALGVAAAVAGFAGSAFAVTDLAGGTAARMAISTTGVGHTLVVPYFSTQNGNQTLLSLVNTDTTVGKAVKVRFRGASNSDDIYDFQVFLSPGDVWTANISANADGVSFLTTADNSCTKPSKSVINSTPFVTTRLPGDADTKAKNTREGYIEIFNMADMPSGSAIYTATKHVSGVAPCSGAAWTALNTDTNNATLTGATIGFAAPTTGLAANWTIINAPNAVAWSGSATGIEAVDAGDVAVTGNVVYFPQTSVPITKATADAFTADPLLRTGGPLTGALYDLPDMSTPYGSPVISPSVQASALSGSIAATSVMNEFWTLPGISAKTDWVFSMPTRRYAVAVDYNAVGGAERVFNTANALHFIEGNTSLVDNQVCVRDIVPAVWDREEGTPAAPDDVVISPGTPADPVNFCGEASVLSFDHAADGDSSVLGAQVAVKHIGVPYAEGWAKLTTPGATSVGLPILGQAFVSAFNPEAKPGVSGNYNMGWAHRFTRP